MTAKIRIRAITKTYVSDHGPVPALSRTDLDIDEGEFVSIVGPSGCGKSTLLYIVGGFIAAEGEVLVDGKPISGPGIDRGVVFQEYALFPWLTVRRNILYGLENRDYAPQQRAQIADRLIGVIGLKGFEHRYPRELSGGMKQRVALARTLAGDPAVLLLDEPFGALDALTRIRMHALLKRLCERRQPAVLLVTHDVDEAIELADRVVVLDDGRIVADLDVRLPPGGPARVATFTRLRRELLGFLGVEDELAGAEAP